MVPNPSASMFLSNDNNDNESRAIDFYQSAVAPCLPRAEGDWYEFWHEIILQMAEHNVAIRHITVAVSSLFEEAEIKKDDSLIKMNSDAIKKCNMAITELLKSQDPQIMLFASRMFLMADFAGRNVVGAFRHDDHGLAIFKTLKDKHSTYAQKFTLSFDLMRVLKFFFFESHDHVQGQRIPTWGTWWLKVVGALQKPCWSELMDGDIIYQATQFIQVKEADITHQTDVPHHISEKRTALLDRLDQHLALYQTQLKQAVSSTEEDFTRRERYMKDLVVKICLEACLSRDKSEFLRLRPDLDTIVAQSPINSTHICQGNKSLQQLIPLSSEFYSRLLNSSHILPILSFVFLHCGHVKVQMHAITQLYSIPDLYRRYSSPSLNGGQQTI
jgi:hypothetical protein